MSGGNKFSLQVVIASALVLAFVGFAAGYNWIQLSSAFAGLTGSQSGDSLPADLDYAELEQVYDLLRENFAGSLDASLLLEGAKKGLVSASGDPNTSYLTGEEAKEFQQDLEGTFSGIGAEIAVKNGKLVVVAPLSGTPADKAGLRAGDRIVRIEGQDTSDITVDEAVNLIRGQSGTFVMLEVARGNRPVRDYKIKRAQIEVPSVRSEIKAKNIGYIELIRFDETSAKVLEEAVNDLKGRGATSFILDVRNNPGGLLQAAVDIADQALGVGKTIVEERRDSEVIRTFRATEGGVLTEEKLAVLINEGSASASEIIAGALKENNVAQIIGEQSFGKGSVQELIKVNGQQSYLKVTIARWYTPNGNNINESGVEPDIPVKLSIEDFDNNRDPQLARAIRLLQQ